METKNPNKKKKKIKSKTKPKTKHKKKSITAALMPRKLPCRRGTTSDDI